MNNEMRYVESTVEYFNLDECARLSTEEEKLEKIIRRLYEYTDKKLSLEMFARVSFMNYYGENMVGNCGVDIYNNNPNCEKELKEHINNMLTDYLLSDICAFYYKDEFNDKFIGRLYSLDGTTEEMEKIVELGNSLTQKHSIRGLMTDSEIEYYINFEEGYSRDVTLEDAYYEILNAINFNDNNFKFFKGTGKEDVSILEEILNYIDGSLLMSQGKKYRMMKYIEDHVIKAKTKLKLATRMNLYGVKSLVRIPTKNTEYNRSIIEEFLEDQEVKDLRGYDCSKEVIKLVSIERNKYSLEMSSTLPKNEGIMECVEYKGGYIVVRFEEPLIKRLSLSV